MDDLWRRLGRLGPGSSQVEVVETLLRGERTDRQGLGECPACQGRQVLLREFLDPEDCPTCFGTGCRLTRAHLDLAAFAGQQELRELLVHSGGPAPCWCDSSVEELGEFLLALQSGWGVLPGVVALCAAIGPREPPDTVRVDPASMEFVHQACDWLEERIDLLELIFGPEGWFRPFDLLDLTWVDSLSALEARPLLGAARAAVAAWGCQPLASCGPPWVCAPSSLSR